MGAQLLETRIPGRFGNALPEEREPVTGRLEAGVRGVVLDPRSKVSV